LAFTEICHVCHETMIMSVQPVERQRFLPVKERPSILPTTMSEWLCPNGHYRELTYAENRMFE